MIFRVDESVHKMSLFPDCFWQAHLDSSSYCKIYFVYLRGLLGCLLISDQLAGWSHFADGKFRRVDLYIVAMQCSHKLSDFRYSVSCHNMTKNFGRGLVAGCPYLISALTRALTLLTLKATWGRRILFTFWSEEKEASLLAH